jgi:hypothetical protein
MAFLGRLTARAGFIMLKRALCTAPLPTRSFEKELASPYQQVFAQLMFLHQLAVGSEWGFFLVPGLANLRYSE